MSLIFCLDHSSRPGITTSWIVSPKSVGFFTPVRLVRRVNGSIFGTLYSYNFNS